MILKLNPFRIRDEQRELTRHLIMILNLSKEEFHVRDVVNRDMHHLSSVGVALMCGKVELLSEVESRLAYGAYRRVFDIDPDDRGITIDMKLYELYGWNNFIDMDWRNVGLAYCDNRLMLTYAEVAAILQAALDGKEKIFI